MSARLTGRSRSIAWLVLLGACGWAAAEDPLPPGPPGADRGHGEASSDTYVNDSFEAREMLSELAGLEESGRWGQASRLVQDLMTLHGDKLVAVDQGGYESIVAQVNRRVAAWPGEGLTVYRSLYDVVAAGHLERALGQHDLDALVLLLERYFCTSVTAKMGETVCEMALEAGDFALARRTCLDLMSYHPDRTVLKDRFSGWLAICNALAGDSDAAEQWLAQQSARSEALMLRWSGLDQPVSGIVRALLDEPRAVDTGLAASTWPIFGGDGGRNRAGTFSFDRLVLLWRYADFSWPGADERSSSASLRRALESGRFLVSYPVVGHGLVYFQDKEDVWALDVASGAEVWHHGPDAKAAGRSGLNESALPGWHSPTLAGDRLFACLGSDPAPFYGYEDREGSAAVVCLDALTGQVHWRAGHSELGESFAKTSFDSSPLVQGDSVYVVSRRRRTFGFQDCYLLRFGVDDGTLRWQTHLGSASTGGFGYRRATRSIPALVDDTVYVNTQLGTVAAVSARTGRVRWLRVYDREQESEWRQRAMSSSEEVTPWQYNPTILWADRLVCRPNDAPSVLVMDRTNGRIVRAFDVEELEGVECLLGVSDQTLYGVGRRAIAFDLSTETMKWTSALPDGSGLHGRGTLSGGRMLVPTREALCAYDLSDGRLVEHPWETAGGGGNLTAVGDRLVLAATDHVSVYAPRGQVWQRLLGQMAAEPGNPAPALELAEISFRSGDREQAANLLDESVRRSGGFLQPVADQMRVRLFRDCLWFARDWAVEGPEDRRRVERFYEYAGLCASDTASHLECRFRFAEYLGARGNPERAIGLYQQILSDRSLREAPAGSERAEDVTAGEWARRRIEALIAEHGRAVYVEFDGQAQAWLQAARSSGDMALLDRLVQTFPSAEVVPESLLLKGRLQREHGEAEAAARTFLAVYDRYRGAAEPPVLIRLIADSYDEAGKPEYAWRWLTKGAGEYPQARIDVNGEKVTLLEYRRRWASLAGRVEVRYPRVTRPLTETYERSYSQSVELLEPILGASPDSDWTRVFVYSGAAVEALDGRTGAPVWAEPAPCRAQPNLLLTTPSRVVLATRHQVLGLAAETGDRVWSLGRYPADLAEPGADPEWFATFYDHAYDAGRLLSIHDDGRAACLEVESGGVVWEQNLAYRPTSRLVLFDRWVAYRGLSQGRVGYVLLDSGTGDLIGAIEPQEESHVLRMYLTLDGKLVVVGMRLIEAYDAETQARLWRHRRSENVREPSVQVGLDGLYLSDDTEHVDKINLHDGSSSWRTESLFGGSADRIQTFLKPGQLLAVSDRGVAGIDPVNGRVQWEAGPGPRTSLGNWRKLADSLAAVGVEQQDAGLIYRVHFFGDRRRQSPEAAGENVVELGGLEDVRRVMVADEAVVLLDGRRLMGRSAGK